MKKLALLLFLSMPAAAQTNLYLGVDSLLSGSKGSVQYGFQFANSNGDRFGYELVYTKYESEYSYGLNVKPSFPLVNNFFVTPIAGYHKFSNDRYSPVYGIELSHHFNFFEIRTGVKKNDSGIDDNVNYYVGGALRY
ncbi:MULTISPECIES: hypothetical protein [Vibrio]|nr:MULTISPECIES: hypothetical protein [Vibrio]